MLTLAEKAGCLGTQVQKRYSLFKKDVIYEPFIEARIVCSLTELLGKVIVQTRVGKSDF